MIVVVLGLLLAACGAVSAQPALSPSIEADADYLLTTVDNGTNNHQNNLRISAGVVVNFGEK